MCTTEPKLRVAQNEATRSLAKHVFHHCKGVVAIHVQIGANVARKIFDVNLRVRQIAIDLDVINDNCTVSFPSKTGALSSSVLSSETRR